MTHQYATFITGQMNSMTEKAKAGEKIGGGTWYGRRKNVSGTKEESDEIDKEMDAGRAERTKAWKDEMDKKGATPILNKTEHEREYGSKKIQARVQPDDPKPWVRTKGMERPWRKDKKPLPMGDVAKEYNKKYPKAAQSRATDLDYRKMHQRKTATYKRPEEKTGKQYHTAAEGYADFISSQNRMMST